MGRETIRVIQTGQRRIKLFVDFWNVVINARNQSKKFDLEVQWDKLAELIVRATRSAGSDEAPGELAGCYIFGSVARSNPEQSKFVDKVLDEYGSVPGLFFNFADRVSKQTSITCSGCGDAVKTQSESGVDVLLAVEMIKHATMREHEYLALVSSDRDFVPLLSYLKDQGHRVLHAAPSGPDRQIRSITWTQVALSQHYAEICKLNHAGYIVLTAPNCSDMLEELVAASPVPADSLLIIDIAQKDQLSDQDLEFVRRHFGLSWHAPHDPSIRYFDCNVPEIRRGLSVGDMMGNLPYVIKNGATELYYSMTSGLPWMQAYATGAEKRWPTLLKRGR